MVRNAICACAVVALISLTVFAGDKKAADAKNGPRMVITPASWDFGSVREGKVVKRAFEVRNTGRSVLVIQSAMENCECVKAKLERERIEPEKSALVFITVDTAGEAGAFTGTVSILSNDPDAPMRTIRITGTVKGR